MNVVTYDGRVFGKAFPTFIWIIFWVSCHFKSKKKKRILRIWYKIVCTSSWKKKIRNPGGNFGIITVFGGMTLSGSRCGSLDVLDTRRRPGCPSGARLWPLVLILQMNINLEFDYQYHTVEKIIPNELRHYGEVLKEVFVI